MPEADIFDDDSLDIALADYFNTEADNQNVLNTSIGSDADKIIAQQIIASTSKNKLRFATNPMGYCEDAGFTPWESTKDNVVSQASVVQMIAKHVIKSLEYYNANNQTYPPLRMLWVGGNSNGKSELAAMLALWFTEAFEEAVTVAFAPTEDQLEKIFWHKTTKHANRFMPERLGEFKKSLKAEIGTSQILCKVAKSEEGLKGTHREYMLLIGEEADGLQTFAVSAANTMVAGAKVAIIIYLYNPRLADGLMSMLQKDPNYIVCRFNNLDHPNVVTGEQIIPGAVDRTFVLEQLLLPFAPCIKVKEHDPKKHTFSLSWYEPETIWQPSNNFMTTVLGQTPLVGSSQTFFTEAVFGAAVLREEPLDGYSDTDILKVGVDAARAGADSGTIYIVSQGVVEWVDSINLTSDLIDGGLVYTQAIVQAVKKYHNPKIHKALSVRVDMGGGYGTSIVDSIGRNEYLRGLTLRVHSITHQGNAENEKLYANHVTELYAEAALETNYIKIGGYIPPILEDDLVRRRYEFKTVTGSALKRIYKKYKMKTKGELKPFDVLILEQKKVFKKRRTANKNKSPDDGDGFVYAVAPEKSLKPLKASVDATTTLEMVRVLNGQDN